MAMKLMSTFLLLWVINVSQYVNVKGDGMTEVFQWKQMDFYNRGDGINRAGETNLNIGGTRPRPKPSAGGIIFPDQLPYRQTRSYRVKRASEAITSRDQPVTTASRASFAADPATNSSSYIAYNNVPMGATHHKGRLFVTMPRRRVGIPSTLNFIDMRQDGSKSSPKLYAYPNFEINQLSPNFAPNPEHIISVYRTTVDACNRLWFIDTGMLEYPDNRMQVQRPAIWIMDLTTDRVVRRFEIPTSIVDTGRGLASITIDQKPDRCGQAFAYIPDLVNNQLYVYSFEQNHIWAFSHNYFNFDPLGGDLSVGGQNFRWDDGIFSITLGKELPSGYRQAYFHAMASNNEFVVSSEVLQNEANAGRSDHGNDFQLLGSRGSNRQSTMHEYDPRTGVIFYDEIQRNGVGCWNTMKPFSAENHGTVAQDAQRMIYPSDLTIDEEGTIWMITNSMPIFIYANLDPNIVNFRIWKQNVFKAARNTVCGL